MILAILALVGSAAFRKKIPVRFEYWGARRWAGRTRPTIRPRPEVEAVAQG